MDLSALSWRKSSCSSSNGACAEVAVTWRKSSYSTSNGNCVEVGATWRDSGPTAHSGGARVEAGMTPQKSGSRTSNGGGCVEVARPPVAVVAVRDSKDPEGPVLAFSPAAWQTFTSGLKSGDLPIG